MEDKRSDPVKTSVRNQKKEAAELTAALEKLRRSTKEPPILWRIYYGDGTTFSSEDGRPADAPAWNVQFILWRDDPTQPESVGRRIESGKDFYIWSGSQWVGIDLVGLLSHLAGAGFLKVGEMLPDARWRQIKERALADPDFPRKSAWLKQERPDGQTV